MEKTSSQKHVGVYKPICINQEITESMVRKVNILMATEGTEQM